MSAARVGLSAARRALALALCAGLGGCVKTFDGDGVPADEVRPESGFDRISARGVLEVDVAPGDFAVGVHIDENLISRVTTRVVDSTLVIAFSGGNVGRVLPGPHVDVRLPALLDVELNGSGRLVASGFEGQDAASVELAGSGELSWSGSAGSLDVLLSGGGEIQLSGSAERVDYRLEGSGALDAQGLTARGASIEVEGSGSVQATVDGRVDASVEGRGSIELFGNVTQGTWQETEEGSITAP